MLIDEPKIYSGPSPDLAFILGMIANTNGRSSGVKRLQQGVYEIGHFGCSSFLQGYESFPDIEPGPYGVCDSVEQLIEKCPALQDPDRKFVVTVTPIVRADEPADGGWRWHKWGEYIGTHEQKCEYLYDEVGIDQVLCFHIYEQKPTSAQRSAS